MSKPLETATAMNDYAAFLSRKTQLGGQHGFDPVWLPDWLFDFQAALVEWAVRKGRAAIFADCGLGKTPMQLVWAENVVRHTNRPVLVLTPLAVAQQTVREAEKFGVDAVRCMDGKPSSGARIVVTNYEKLHLFSPDEFSGVVCDESSILKNYSGTRRQEISDFMQGVEYRLLATATPAPNDWVELGTSSEALGYLRRVEMLAMHFTHDGGDTQKWRIKGHAQGAFWSWMGSWSRAIRRPSDLGFDDAEFILPPLNVRESVVPLGTPQPGNLFAMPAETLADQRVERKLTMTDRCERVRDAIADADSAVAWCHLNDESDLLTKLIPGAVAVSGADDDQQKVEAFEAFASGQIRVLVTKPSIAGFGLNWQHCARMTFFPSHSFEQYYQAVRRSWRFGQKRTVTVEIVTSEGEAGVLENLQRKQQEADQMFALLVEHMAGQPITEGTVVAKQLEAPSWA